MQNIPLPIFGVDSAEILALDADGETANRTQIDIRNGRPIFPSWMAGASNGIMVVKYNDGSVMTFNLWDPQSKVPVSSTESADYKISGHHVYTADGTPLTVKIIETWERPSVFIGVSVHTIVTLDVMGIVNMNGSTVFERPVLVTLTNQETGQKTEIKMGPEPRVVALPVGEWRATFEWTNFGQPNTLYTGPMGDGGKG
jgi:hypothetical protein